MFVLDAAVESAEAVNESFQLGGHAVVVQRGDKYHHIRIQNHAAEFLHIVLLNAGALVAAVDAPGAGADIAVGGVNHLYGVAGLLRAADQLICQHIGGAVFVGTALQHDDFHKISSASLLHFLFPEADDVQARRIAHSLPA